MRKKILFLSTILVALVLLSGCGKKVVEPAESDTTATTPDQPGEEADGEEDYTGSIADLIAKGKAIECTFKAGDDSRLQMLGKAYVANKKARQEVTLTDLEDPGDTRFNRTTINIFHQDWMYNWVDGETTGTKISMKKLEEGIKDVAKDTPDLPAAPPPAKTDDTSFKCNRWQVDESKFELPAGVTFTEETYPAAPSPATGDTGSAADQIKEMMENAPTEEEQAANKQSLCDTCNSMPNADVCRASLGCE